MVKIHPVPIVLGSDPEGFFRIGKRIVGSEKLIPPDGLQFKAGSIHRDGVQFELHPNEGTARQLITNTGHLVSSAFAITRQFPGASICFDGLVEVEREELASLSPQSQVLGCMPSLNHYGHKDIDVDPVAYRKRSSGGHIHFGITHDVMYKNRRKLVPLADRVIGNTCVLFDRDPGAAERRENYGRAGEFRLPKHGLEYRTISNFWLRDPVLMDLVFGLAHITVSLFQQAAEGDKDAWSAVLDCVTDENVVLAINNNDFQLALANFAKMSKVLREILPISGFVLNEKLVDNLKNWAVAVNKNGIEKFFPTSGIEKRWVSRQKETLRWFIM